MPLPFPFPFAGGFRLTAHHQRRISHGPPKETRSRRSVVTASSRSGQSQFRRLRQRRPARTLCRHLVSRDAPGGGGGGEGTRAASRSAGSTASAAAPAITAQIVLYADGRIQYGYQGVEPQRLRHTALRPANRTQSTAVDFSAGEVCQRSTSQAVSRTSTCLSSPSISPAGSSCSCRMRRAVMTFGRCPTSSRPSAR